MAMRGAAVVAVAVVVDEPDLGVEPLELEFERPSSTAARMRSRFDAHGLSSASETSDIPEPTRTTDVRVTRLPQIRRWRPATPPPPCQALVRQAPGRQ
jgi:hypothetical protein